MEKRSFKKVLLGTVLSAALAIVPAAIASAASVSVSWDPDKLIVNNNEGVADTVYLSGLPDKAVLKVYDKDPALASKTVKVKMLGQGTVKDGAATATVGNLTQNADIFVTVTMETTASSIKVGAPKQTDKVVTSQVYVNNYNGIADQVTVTGLTYAGSKVSVYKGSTEIAFATTVKDPKKGTIKDVVINIPTKNALGSAAGTVDIVVKDQGKLKSDPVTVNYDAEGQSDVTSVTYTAYNNYNKNDVIEVYGAGLAVGDAIQLYSDSGAATKIGTPVKAVKVGSGTRKGQIIATISKKDLFGTSGNTGTIYYTVKKSGYLESAPQTVNYPAEDVTTFAGDGKPSVTGIVYTNTKSTGDKVVITGNPSISKGDKVSVYESGGTTALGSGTASANGSVTISLSSKLQASGGKIQITVAQPYTRESIKSDEVVYGAEK